MYLLEGNKRLDVCLRMHLHDDIVLICATILMNRNGIRFGPFNEIQHHPIYKATNMVHDCGKFNIVPLFDGEFVLMNYK